MKYISTIVACFTLLTPTLAQEFILTHTKSGKEILLGEIDEIELRNNEFAEWYVKNYEGYHPNDSLSNALKQKLKDVDIKIFMGTWCGDSRREVPRFISILSSIGYDFSRLKIICVDYEDNDKKQSPGHQESGLKIYRVPTFIFSQNGNEIGRIVEYPVESLEQDMINVIEGSYAPNYQYYYNIMNDIDTLNYSQMKLVRRELFDKYQEYFLGNGKLLTLCKVLFFSQRISQCKFLLELQLELNPTHNAAIEFSNFVSQSIGDK